MKMVLTRKALYRAAYVNQVVTCVFVSLTIIGMCWAIPMTLRTKKAFIQAGTSLEISHTALGVWSKFFMSSKAAQQIILASGDFVAENY